MSYLNLPPALMALFEPPPEPEFKKPMDKKKRASYTGVAEFKDLLEPCRKEEDGVGDSDLGAMESSEKKRQRRREERMKRHQQLLEEARKNYDPKEQVNVPSDPRKTLFVARLSWETTERKLRKEFEQYGPVASVRMVCNEEGIPRGYAFVEFEREEDMTTAFKKAEGRSIDGHRILVDVERGRTVKGWLPRRLGGGKGTGRPEKEKKEVLEARMLSTARGPPPYGDPRGGGGGYRGGGFREDRMGGGPRYGRPGLGFDRDRDREPRERYRPGGGREPRASSRDRDRDRSRSSGGYGGGPPRDRYRPGSRDRDRSRDRGGVGGRRGHGREMSSVNMIPVGGGGGAPPAPY